MKNFIIVLALFLLSTQHAQAQVKAVTEEGDEVILFKDGTWKYTSDKKTAEIKLDTLYTKKAADATFLLKSKKISCGVWLNPKKWKFEKDANDTEPNEYSFTLNGEDVYAMFIPEKGQIPMDSWKAVAVENAKSVAPDIEVVSEGIRNVNGIDVYCMQLNGTIKGIKFTYFGYYYSSEKGSAQFITYTFQSLFKQYKPEMEKLLNGFVQTDENL
jgi:hypothetical protein